MAPYRRKILVDARQVTGDEHDIRNLAMWCSGWAVRNDDRRSDHPPGLIILNAVRGDHSKQPEWADLGDWIVMGANGTFSVVHADVFDAHWEAV